MATYLFECEIVEASIVSLSEGNQKRSIVVIPMNSIRPSDLIGGSKFWGIALGGGASGENASLKSISLNENGQAEFSITDATMAAGLFSCRNQRVVLELNDKDEVVGFKARF